jgi:hypothetical protein
MRGYLYIRRYESESAIETQHASRLGGGRSPVDLADWIFGCGGTSFVVLQIGFGKERRCKKLLQWKAGVRQIHWMRLARA